MGKVIDFAQGEARPLAPGVSAVPLLDWFDSSEMMASVVRLGPEGRHEIKVPAGSDHYLYVIAGAPRLDDAVLAPGTWVILEEGKMQVKDLPIIDLPAEKKRRTYLANEEIAGSARGHAMIVRYTGETLTKRHHHPNAESLFVVLEGKVEFLVDGKKRVLGAGEAAFFPMNDSHGLRSGDGKELSFLEFHIPGAFVTEYDE
jgi:mannose-6-phosphate isomerase-like protein (cupin superfamily)